MCAEPKPATLRETDHASERTRAGPHRILIVDDEDAIRDAFASMFRHSDLDCEVETAPDGVAAIKKIPGFRPDLIVLDLVMPLLDGYEICHIIRASEELRDTKVLLVTGYPDDIRLHMALLAGADGWITKPCSADELESKARELLCVSGHPA